DCSAALDGDLHLFSYGSPCLINGGIGVGACPGVRISDGDAPELLPADYARPLLLGPIGIGKGVVLISVTVRPAIYGDAGDVAGITVNRWANGYAYEYNSLSDPDWPEEQRPCVIGRQKFGRISIANSDAGASAYTDTAID